MAFSRLPYTQHRGVKAHPGSILVLAATADGTMLATGGSQGTRLYNTNRMSQVRRPSAVGTRGATCTLLWVRPIDTTGDVLFSGTQNGYFFCWRQRGEDFEEVFSVQISLPAEITGLAYDPTSSRLGICSRNDYVQAWAIVKDPTSDAWTPKNIFSQQYAKLAPQAIMFSAYGNTRDRDILVFGMHSGGPICTLRGQTGEEVGVWSVGAKIGDAAVNWRDGALCLDDPFSGAALYRISDQVKVHTFETPRERSHEARPRHVRFSENGLSVVMGSDHGTVYVFETRSGQILQKLNSGSTEWIQTVATAETDGISVIFAAKTRALDACEEIFVWKRARNPRLGWDHVQMIFKAFVVFGCVAFLYQNLEGQMREATERVFELIQVSTTRVR